MLSVVCRQMVEKAAASFKIKREEEPVSRQDDVCVGVCGCACITDAQRTISVYESVCVCVIVLALIIMGIKISPNTFRRSVLIERLAKTFVCRTKPNCVLFCHPIYLEAIITHNHASIHMLYRRKQIFPLS